MGRHIDNALRGWDCEPGVVQRATRYRARIRGNSSRCGLIWASCNWKPRAGPKRQRPHGFPSYFEYLRQEARLAKKTPKPFALSEEQCQEADREFVQYYHRRICWLALRNYENAIADADHTLAFMDLVREHSPNDDYTQAHEQYRGFVTFQRTQGAAALALEKHDPEAAIDAVRGGLARLKAFFANFGAEEQMEEDGMVQHLRRIETSLREQHGIETTLQEQLDQAIANEEYETAARLRDALKQRPS